MPVCSSQVFYSSWCNHRAWLSQLIHQISLSFTYLFVSVCLFFFFLSPINQGWEQKQRNIMMGCFVVVMVSILKWILNGMCCLSVQTLLPWLYVRYDFVLTVWTRAESIRLQNQSGTLLVANDFGFFPASKFTFCWGLVEHYRPQMGLSFSLSSAPLVSDWVFNWCQHPSVSLSPSHIFLDLPRSWMGVEVEERSLQLQRRLATKSRCVFACVCVFVSYPCHSRPGMDTQAAPQTFSKINHVTMWLVSSSVLFRPPPPRKCQTDDGLTLKTLRAVHSRLKDSWMALNNTGVVDGNWMYCNRLGEKEGR